MSVATEWDVARESLDSLVPTVRELLGERKSFHIVGNMASLCQRTVPVLSCVADVLTQVNIEMVRLREENERLTRGVTAGRHTVIRPRWAHYAEMSGHGSTVSVAAVVACGLDPDETTG